MADAVLTGGWKLDAAPGAKKGVRDLYQNAGTITGLRICPDGTAVSETLEYLQSLPDDLVALAVLDVANKADTAGVALEGRVIESLRGW